MRGEQTDWGQLVACPHAGLVGRIVGYLKRGD